MELTSAGFKSRLLSEAQANLQLAIPLVIAQFAEVGINTVNVVMMGLLGTQSLAAGALGAIVFFTILYMCEGTLEAVGTKVAQAFGAEESDRVGIIAIQGLWLAAALSFMAMVLLWQGDTLLSLAGQDPTNVLLAKSYLQTIIWGLPAALGFWALKSVASALNRPQFITVILVVGLLLDVPVSYALIFGHLGLPALGLAGIGWATTLVFWLQFLAAIGWLSFHPSFREYKIFGYLYQFDKVLFGEIFQTGWPLGFQFASESALFTVTALLMGYLGTDILAAHEIAIQTAEIVMVIPFGIYSVTLARVGQMVGKQDISGARRVAFVSLAFTTLFASTVALIFWLFPEKIVGIYLDINNLDNAEAVKAAISFLRWAALLQLFYGIHGTAIAALTGINDTRLPMLISILAFWGVGLSVGYLTGFVLGGGGTGIWLGLTLGPAMTSVIYIWRFFRLVSTLVGSHQKGQHPALK